MAMGGDPEDLVQFARLYQGSDEEAVLINMLADEIEQLNEALRIIAEDKNYTNDLLSRAAELLARAAIGRQE